MNLDILYILSIIIFGVMTGFTDIKYKKIRNKTIILILITKIILDIIAIKTETYPLENILNSYKNMLFFFIISFILYILNLMNPGDVKYISTIIGLIPLQFQTQTMFLERVLTFIFITMGVVFIKDIYTKIKNKQILKTIKKVILSKDIIIQIIGILSIYLITTYVLEKFKLNPNIMVRVIIIYLIINQIKKLKTNYKKITMGILLSAGIILNLKNFTNPIFWKNYIVFTILFLTFRIIIINLINDQNYKIKKVENLTEKDLPYENIKYTIELRKIKNIKIQKINKEIFTNPKYTFNNHIFFFIKIKDITKTKVFPKHTNFEFAFDNKREINSETRYILDKLELKTIKVHKRIAMCPHITAGILLFIIKNYFF